MNDQFAPSAFVFANPLALFLVWLLAFGISGGVAALVAPPPRRMEFFLLTFFFLGPFGVGFAAVAPSRPPKDDGAMVFACKVCGVVQNIPHSEDDPTCYRCNAPFHFAR